MPDPTYTYLVAWRNDDGNTNHGYRTLNNQVLDQIDDQLDYLKKHILSQLDAVEFVDVVVRIKKEA